VRQSATFRLRRRVPELWKTPALFLAIALIASTAFPAGFSIFEQGAKATAMGGAFAAQADDPSAIFYNPAGLGFQRHYSIMVGTTVISILKQDFRGANPYPGVGTSAKGEHTTFFPSHLYLVVPVTERVNFGFGVFTPFGLGVRWQNPETFSGRFVAQNSVLRTFSFEPVFSFRATDTFSIAAGAEYRLSYVQLERNQAAIDPFTNSAVDVAHIKLKSDNAHAWGWNAGILWKPDPHFSVGLSYRSKMTIDYSGKAKFTQRPTGDPAFDALVATELPAGAISTTTSIDFPAIVTTGVALKSPEHGCTLEFDADWMQWSQFRTLNILFPNHEVPDVGRNEDWKDAWSYRVGFEKTFHALALRAGFLYDQNPQPDKSVSPLLPDADRIGYSLGLGYNTERWGLDIADLYLPFHHRSTNGVSQDNYNGSYEKTANLFSLSFRMSF
jgi:long-chain fatty acid transport protein